MGFSFLYRKLFFFDYMLFLYKSHGLGLNPKKLGGFIMLELNMIELKHCDVIYYPYRKGMVNGTIITFNCETEDEREEYQEIQQTLAKKVTKVFSDNNIVNNTNVIVPDNHTCYQVGKIALMFSDYKIIIGSNVIIQ